MIQGATLEMPDVGRTHLTRHGFKSPVLHGVERLESVSTDMIYCSYRLSLSRSHLFLLDMYALPATIVSPLRSVSIAFILSTVMGRDAVLDLPLSINHTQIVPERYAGTIASAACPQR